MSEPSKKSGGEQGGHVKQSKLTWIIPAVLIGGLLLLYFLVPAVESFIDEAYAILTSGDRQRTEEWVSGFGVWGPVAILSFMVAQTVVPVIPSFLIMVVGVLAFGPVFGGLLIYGGLLLAAAVAYGIGRALGPVIVDRLVGHSTEQKMEHFVNEYGLWGVIVARVSPIVSTDAVSIVAGLVRMGFARFMLATALGTLPLTVLIAYLGEDIERLQSGLVWVSVISIAAFVIYVIYDRTRKSKGTT